MARLRHNGIRTSEDHVLQLLRENQLLSPARAPEPVRSNPREGTIIAEVPNQMWGTDAIATFTQADGTVTVFAAIDHCTAECIGVHAVKKATRFEALEPIRQGVKEQFGAFSAGVSLRHDHGSVYMSDDFQKEIRPWASSPLPRSCGSREGNGCTERFLCTLKEQLLWIRHFRDLEELCTALVEFRNPYSHHWILQRLNYRTPVQARCDFTLELQAVA